MVVVSILFVLLIGLAGMAWWAWSGNALSWDISI